MTNPQSFTRYHLQNLISAPHRPSTHGASCHFTHKPASIATNGAPHNNTFQGASSTAHSSVDDCSYNEELHLSIHPSVHSSTQTTATSPSTTLHFESSNVDDGDDDNNILFLDLRSSVHMLWNLVHFYQQNRYNNDDSYDETALHAQVHHAHDAIRRALSNLPLRDEMSSIKSGENRRKGRLLVAALAALVELQPFINNTSPVNSSSSISNSISKTKSSMCDVLEGQNNHSNANQTLYQQVLHELLPCISCMDTFQLTSVLSSLSTLRYRHIDVLDKISKRLMDFSSFFCGTKKSSSAQSNTIASSRSIYHICIVLQSAVALDFVPPPSPVLNDIITACISHHRLFSPRSISSFLNTLARHGHIDDIILTSCMPMIQSMIPHCTMRELADISRTYTITTITTNTSTITTILQSDHTIGQREVSINIQAATDDVASKTKKMMHSNIKKQKKILFEAIAARAAQCVTDASLQNITSVITAFHRLNLQPEALLDVVEAWADRRLASLPPRALSHALANFARLGNQTPRLLETAARCVRAQVREMNGEDLGRIVWAFARLDYHPGELILDHAVHALQGCPQKYSDRIIANLLWALTRFNFVFKDDDMRRIAANLTPIAGSYSGQSAALVVWSVATWYQHSMQSSQHDNSLRNADDTRTKNRRSTITPLLTNTTANITPATPPFASPSWTASQPASSNRKRRARIDVSIVIMVQHMVDVVQRDFSALDPQSISLTAWSLGTLGIRHDVFVQQVCQECRYEERLVHFEPQSISNVVWGLAKILTTTTTSGTVRMPSSGTMNSHGGMDGKNNRDHFRTDLMAQIEQVSENICVSHTV